MSTCGVGNGVTGSGATRALGLRAGTVCARATGSSLRGLCRRALLGFYCSVYTVTWDLHLTPVGVIVRLPVLCRLLRGRLRACRGPLGAWLALRLRRPLLLGESFWSWGDAYTVVTVSICTGVPGAGVLFPLLDFVDWRRRCGLALEPFLRGRRLARGCSPFGGLLAQCV